MNVIALPLIQKLAELFLILFATAALVKGRIVKPDDSKALARLSLNLVTPCVIFNSFQKELTPDVVRGLLTALCLALLFQGLFILFALLLKKTWHATDVERASLIFTNAGNLIIPIVSYVLGAEYVIYVSGYITVFNILCWTYGLRMFDSDSRLSLGKLLLNPNILAVFAGLLFLFLGIRLPGPIAIAFDDVAAMIGPLSMMITGVVVGTMHLKDLTANRRIWAVLFFRMVACSGLAVALAVCANALGLTAGLTDGKYIVMIALLSAIAPSASNINQLAILYNKDARYASAINVLSTLSCILTMPLWVMLYEALVR